MSTHGPPSQRGNRLRAAITQLRARAGGDRPLETLIRQSTGITVDRRRIERLVSGGNVLLSLAEFEAIEQVAIDLGLGALFLAQPTLLRELASGRRIRIAVGTHIEAQKSYCAVFDLMSSVKIVEGLERVLDSAISWEPEQVPPHHEMPMGERRISEVPTSALISLGSSLANTTSELLLSKGFDIPPFRGSGLYDGAPAFFVWDDDELFESSFCINRGELMQRWPHLCQDWIAPAERRRRGLLMRTKEGQLKFLPEFERSPSPGGDPLRWGFGLLVALRQYGSLPKVVCAGLNGPSTMLVAQMLSDGALAQNLPRLESGQKGLYYAIVRGIVSENPAKRGDNRHIANGEVLMEQHRNVRGPLWNPS